MFGNFRGNISCIQSLDCSIIEDRVRPSINNKIKIRNVHVPVNLSLVYFS